VLDLLHASPTPLTPVDVGEHYRYYSEEMEATRQILSRMHRAGQIACPRYGYYTTLDHPCLSPKPSKPPVGAGSSHPRGCKAGANKVGIPPRATQPPPWFVLLPKTTTTSPTLSPGEDELHPLSQPHLASLICYNVSNILTRSPPNAGAITSRACCY
jgi:hypothetical protein